MKSNYTFFCSECNSSASCKAKLHFISFLCSPVSLALKICVLHDRAPFTKLTAQILCKNSNFLCYCCDTDVVILRMEISRIFQKAVGALEHQYFFMISQTSGFLVFRYSKCRPCNRYSMSTQPKFSMWREVTQSTLMELCKLENDQNFNVH